MTIVLDRAPATAPDGSSGNILPPTRVTTADGYDMYDDGGLKPGDRIEMRPEFDDHGESDPRAGTVVRVDDDGSAFPIIVWLDEFGRQSPAEKSAAMGLPVCAGDVWAVGQ